MSADMGNESGPVRGKPPDLLQLFIAFLRIAATAFGGSTQAWVYRDVVERRRWLTDQQFAAGFAVAQLLPGSNPLNIALYVGLHLRGAAGAAAAACGMVLPAFCIVLLLGYLYRAYGNIAAVHVLLGGVAAVGIGATLTVGLKLTARLPKHIGYWIIAVGTFVTVGLLHWPLLPVVIVLVPISVALSYFLYPVAPPT
jgi:chromate transporter